MQLKLSGAKIWLYKNEVDFRKSIDGLVSLIVNEMEMTPTEGIFVFCNRSKDKLKVLAWHGNGFILLYKRLEKGKFTPVCKEKQEPYLTLSNDQLSWLLAGLNWDQMSYWNTLAYDNYC
jgi:transposase